MSRGKKDSSHVRLFHYTNTEGIRGIATSGKIHQSTDTQRDAVYGPGTYATKLGPEKSKMEVARNNYDGMSSFYRSQEAQGKVDHAVEFKVDKSAVTKAKDSRDIWVHRGDVDLNKAKDVKFHIRNNDGSFHTLQKK